MHSVSVTKKIRTAFWGSPEIAAELLSLLHNHSDFEIALVVSQQDKPRTHRGRELSPTSVKALALEKNLTCITPSSLKKERAQILQKLQELSIDLHVILAYGKIIPAEIFLFPPLQAVNFHAGLLPHLRGASPIESALMLDNKESGWTLQRISEKMDAGDILFQSKVAIEFFDNRESLYQKLTTNLKQIAVPALLAYTRQELLGREQDESLATYCAKIETQDGNINWQLDCIRLRNLARAFGEKIPLFSFLRIGAQTKKIRLFVELSILPTDFRRMTNAPAGSVVALEKHIFWVACGDGIALPIARLQPEGKKIMDAKSFLNGYRLRLGDTFFNSVV